MQIFENDEIKTILLQHKFWYYEIPLKLDIKLMFEFSWLLFEKKFKVIQNYLQINLKE